MPGFEDASFVSLLLVGAVMLFAGLVHGTLGMGFPLMATPLLALMIDVRSAIIITLLPTAAVNIASIVRGGRWRESIGRHWPLAAFALVGSVLGTRLLIVADPAPFKLVLAGIVVVYLNLERLSAVRLTWVMHRPALAYPAFGLFAGFMAGTTNVMVPVLIIFTLELGLAPTAMVQVFNLCFLAGKLSQILTFGYYGTLGGGILLVTLTLAVAALAALAVGMRLRERVAAETYRAWLRRALWVVAGVLIVQYFADM